MSNRAPSPQRCAHSSDNCRQQPCGSSKAIFKAGWWNWSKALQRPGQEKPQGTPVHAVQRSNATLNLGLGSMETEGEWIRATRRRVGSGLLSGDSRGHCIEGHRARRQSRTQARPCRGEEVGGIAFQTRAGAAGSGNRRWPRCGLGGGKESRRFSRTDHAGPRSVARRVVGWCGWVRGKRSEPPAWMGM